MSPQNPSGKVHKFKMADEDENFAEPEKVRSFITDCCFFQSPFVEIRDNAYRMLVAKYGTHVVCLPAVNSSCVDEGWLRRWQVDEGNAYIVQVSDAVEMTGLFS